MIQKNVCTLFLLLTTVLLFGSQEFLFSTGGGSDSAFEKPCIHDSFLFSGTSGEREQAQKSCIRCNPESAAQAESVEIMGDRLEDSLGSREEPDDTELERLGMPVLGVGGGEEVVQLPKELLAAIAMVVTQREGGRKEAINEIETKRAQGLKEQEQALELNRQEKAAAADQKNKYFKTAGFAAVGLYGGYSWWSYRKQIKREQAEINSLRDEIAVCEALLAEREGSGDQKVAGGLKGRQQEEGSHEDLQAKITENRIAIARHRKNIRWLRKKMWVAMIGTITGAAGSLYYGRQAFGSPISD